MHATELKQVKLEKDMGVIVDDQLKFENLEKLRRQTILWGLSGEHLYILMSQHLLNSSKPWLYPI